MVRWSGALVLLLLWGVAGVLDAQLICWQALLRCHDEPACDAAYGQYLAACEGTLRGPRRPCPGHCVGALLRLNQTRGGPDLGTCDCARDAVCLRAQRAVGPCLPRDTGGPAGGPGCTEARRRCEEDRGCHASLAAYLASCGQLFNGRRCSSSCRAAIRQMLLLPAGALLDRCVCDGVERPFCEAVKDNMSRLCAAGDPGPEDQADVDEVYEDEDYDDREEDAADPQSGSWRPCVYLLPLLYGPLARMLV
ncbi:unnamed protein product [Merluccius merluccius]